MAASISPALPQLSIAPAQHRDPSDSCRSYIGGRHRMQKHSRNDDRHQGRTAAATSRSPAEGGKARPGHRGKANPVPPQPALCTCRRPDFPTPRISPRATRHLLSAASMPAEATARVSKLDAAVSLRSAAEMPDIPAKRVPSRGPSLAEPSVSPRQASCQRVLERGAWSDAAAAANRWPRQLARRWRAGGSRCSMARPAAGLPGGGCPRRGSAAPDTAFRRR